MKRPLILAYLVLALGVLALAGLAVDNDPMAATGIVFGVLVASVHGVSFCVRVRGRKEPALLDRTGKWILHITLGAMAGVVIACFVLVVLYDPASGALGFGWMVILGVLAYRAWIVTSARRAGVLQLVAVVVGIPQLMVTFLRVEDAQDAPHDVLAIVVPIAFLVISAAGPVLDKLFASVEDRVPGKIPDAVVVQHP